MAIADHGAPNGAARTATSSLVVTPTSTPSNGDYVYVAILDGPTNPSTYATLSAPDGTWSLLASVASAAWGKSYLYRKVAGASEPSSYTFTWSAGTPFSDAYACAVQSGVASDGTPSTTHDSTSDTTFSIPAITTTANNSRVLAVVYTSCNDSNVNGGFSSWGGGYVEKVDVNDGGGHQWVGLGLAYQDVATAQTISATSVTAANANPNTAIVVEIKASGASGYGKPLTSQTFQSMSVR